MPKKLPADRVLARIVRTEGCWIWPGSISQKGYGMVGGVKGTALVHRVLYEHFVGPIPEGFEIDHLCRNRACANPAHLEAVTRRENQLRGNSFGGINARKTHCPQGHEYAGENLYRLPSRPNSRRCRICLRERRRRQALKKSA